MQTIDSIRQQGALDAVMKQQGCLRDSYDAIKSANDFGSAPISREEIQEEPFPRTEITRSDESSSVLMQKISNLENSKHMLQAKISDLQRGLESTQDALRSALQKIETMDQNMRSMRSSVSSQASQTEQLVREPEPIPEQPRGMPAQQTSAPVAEAISRTDSGKTGGDVSIENIFYCGTR